VEEEDARHSFVIPCVVVAGVTAVVVADAVAVVGETEVNSFPAK